VKLGGTTLVAVVASLVFGSHGGLLAMAAPQSPATEPAIPTRGVSGPREAAELDALTKQVASQLRCPVCQGLSLADSPSELALEMKDVVRSQLASGRSPEEVKQYFVDKYGEWILLEPERRGVNLLVYALPGLAVACGLVTIWLALRRWTSGASAGEAAAGDRVPITDPAD
jgi:cytochrome c-type biogenesis protein CcmH